MHVLFVEPGFPKSQREHVRALAAVGARVTGIGERPAAAFDQELRSWLWGYEQVRSVVDEEALETAVRRIQGREWVDRLETTVEAHVLPVAHVRERCGISGTSVRTAFLCRDKAAMKHALREAGVPCAQSTGASDPKTAREFVARVGYPVIVKPLAAAGAAGAVRCNDDAELDAAIVSHGVDRGRAVALEEFIEGHEGFWDTITVGGRVLHEFASHYYPNVLEAMRTRWISPQIVCTNRVDGDGYRELREMGRKVLGVLGIDTSPTHMEWFFGPKGLKFSEIGCRPPGVGVWDLYCAANEIDVYVEWAKAIVSGQSDVRMSRRNACGMIALRPDRDGRIARYEGIDEIRRRYAGAIVREFLPPPGSPTQGVENGYHANAWMILKHPDYDVLREMLDDVGRTVHVRAE
ncbi:MAG: ATPase [Planctomycetota bacterium]